MASVFFDFSVRAARSVLNPMPGVSPRTLGIALTGSDKLLAIVANRDNVRTFTITADNTFSHLTSNWTVGPLLEWIGAENPKNSQASRGSCKNSPVPTDKPSSWPNAPWTATAVTAVFLRETKARPGSKGLFRDDFGPGFWFFSSPADAGSPPRCSRSHSMDWRRQSLTPKVFAGMALSGRVSNTWKPGNKGNHQTTAVPPASVRVRSGQHLPVEVNHRALRGRDRCVVVRKAFRQAETITACPVLDGHLVQEGSIAVAGFMAVRGGIGC